jgi:hypothetical protein
MLLPTQFPYEVLLRGESRKHIDVEDIANYLRDLVFLHDRLVRLSDSDCNIDKLARSFFYVRGGRSVDARFRLKLTHLRQENPLEIGLIIAGLGVAAGAGWAFFQIVRGCILLSGERKLQQRQIRQNEISHARQLMELYRDFPPPRESHDLLLAVRGVRGERAPASEIEAAHRLVQADVRRLNAGAVDLTDVEIKSELNAEQVKQLAKAASSDH